MSVKDRVAIVTGAGGGLGRLYALHLAQSGAKVVVNDYGGTLDGQPGGIARAQAVADEITAAGCLRIVARAVDTWGRLDILINNAGISGKPSSHADLDPEAFMRVLQIGVLGSQLMTSAAWPVMEAQRHGRIVYIASDAIFGFGAGGDCAYSASKGATFALARDLGRFSPTCGILVNAILPSGASRMGDLSDASKHITRTYFDASPRPRRCPLLRRETTPEGFVKNWDKVMGDAKDVYLPTSTIDHVRCLKKADLQDSHTSSIPDSPCESKKAALIIDDGTLGAVPPAVGVDADAPIISLASPPRMAMCMKSSMGIADSVPSPAPSGVTWCLRYSAREVDVVMEPTCC
ncbi:unnamed protein product [Parascedosporium putredinis]|uniref:Uncharacterized protein n=1 Tax=Parascedosporium putredinis TaxID=1442378 RepID=A0A9P1MEB2_9PEZI|nr:unnamed protein product [Parascedosporium putredinis]CAI8002283.1 unnamed protein product [Parascedosporium putredinis]